MSTPRKAISNQKGRKSARQKESASTAPVPLGKPIIGIPDRIAKDKIAKETWLFVLGAYSKEGYVATEGDVGLLSQYCELESEIMKLGEFMSQEAVGSAEYLEVSKHRDAKRRIQNQAGKDLLLNPVARMRGLPTPKVDDTPSAAKKFMDYIREEFIAEQLAARKQVRDNMAGMSADVLDFQMKEITRMMNHIQLLKKANKRLRAQLRLSIANEKRMSNIVKKIKDEGGL